MDDDEEDFVFYGTPLPEIEDEAVLKKKAAKELEVRDEKGRQRFHGAFTGGFSAGYFNTVGSKEGWAPSSFISSRSKVSDRIQQNPEDFMDDEDFGEFGIATRKIHTTSTFQDASNSSKKRKFLDADTVIPGEAPLKDIVQPVRESIGIIILKKLGWRQGQGIGPRVKKHNTGIKVYGCSPFPESVAPEEEDDPMFAAFTFAPKDTEAVLYQPKDNFFGLGYSGLSKQSVLCSSIDPFARTSTKSWLPKDKKKIKISGQAFGVGAFEDDDEDIYGKDDMSQYDFSDLALTGSEKSHKAVESSNSDNIQGVLEGFHLASHPSSVKNHYPPPVLPPNFKPIHLKSISSVVPNVNLNKSRHALSASDRSLLIGEKKFQKALSDVIAPTVERKIYDNEKEQTLSTESTTSLNYQPFQNDLSKQERYEEYLKLKKTGDIQKLVQPSSMTEWEKQQEMEEFAKSAVFFKPLSNMLSSKFETGAYLSLEQEVMVAIEKMKRKEPPAVKKNLIGTSNRTTFEWHPVPLLCKRMNVANPYPNSNSSGTQSTSKAKSVFDHLSFTDLDDKQKKADNLLPNVTTSLEKVQGAFKTLEAPSANIQKMPDNFLLNKSGDNLPSENKRPPMDFFKDIFENSSSEEEADTSVDKIINISDNLYNSKKEASNLNIPEDSNSTQMDTSSSPKSVYPDTKQLNKFNSSNSRSALLENKKVGFGVFANLDLDALNQRKPSEKPYLKNVHQKSEGDRIELSLASELSNDVSAKDSSQIDDIYGPELPPNFSNPPLPVSSSSKVSKKHSKHKSKHKHHKHKSKKRKKSSRRNSSASDPSDELDDIPPSLIIEKMKKLQKGKI